MAAVPALGCTQGNPTRTSEPRQMQRDHAHTRRSAGITPAPYQNTCAHGNIGPGLPSASTGRQSARFHLKQERMQEKERQKGAGDVHTTASSQWVSPSQALQPASMAGLQHTLPSICPANRQSSEFCKLRVPDGPSLPNLTDGRHLEIKDSPCAWLNTSA
jgi:hypothetical protein